MKFVLAPDSFKESMTAKEVCIAMKNGIQKVIPNAQIIAVPMADGAKVQLIHSLMLQTVENTK